MIAFVDQDRDVHGVEPICRLLAIAPTTYDEQVARRRDPAQLPARAKRDAELRTHIQRVWEENFHVYGVRKVWRQLRREAIRTTVSDKAAPCPLDRVNRDFRAPSSNVPSPVLLTRAASQSDDPPAGGSWVADFTYVAI